MKKVLLIILICISFVIGCKSFSKPDNDVSLVDAVSDKIVDTAIVKSYTIYGRFFNLEGELDTKPENLMLVLKSDDVEQEYNLYTEEENGKFKFKTTKLINKGINLEEIKEGEYLVLLKSEIKTEDDAEVKYYTLEDKSNYEPLTYYTITRNSANKKINIEFKKNENLSLLKLNCEKVKLPSDIYDVVIDAGHGGNDPGATKNGYSESDINLDYAKSLKESLAASGLKIKLTRESDESIPTYGLKSRVGIPYETKAKLLISIHQNSAVTNIGVGGVEIYVANNADTEFASTVVKNIVEGTSTDYSSNKENKILPGVYLRTLKKSDIEAMSKTATKEGYEPYPLASTNSTYYYIIRETGGVVTGAYVDNRNKEKPWNTYYNSNHGTEGYLFELGYINSSKNLKILIDEKDKYIEAIKKSILDYLEI